jgi:hypothetical protein
VGWHEDSYGHERFRASWDRAIRRGEVLTTWDDALRVAIEKRNHLRAQIRRTERTHNVSVTPALKLAHEASEELATKELDRFLDEVRGRVQARLESDARWTLTEGRTFGGKKTWQTDRKRNAASYFEERIAERSLRSSFDVSSPSRAHISEALKTVLTDGSPKFVYRTDIRSCFETIPHAAMIGMLEANRELPRRVVKQVRNLLADYSAIVGTAVGLPRGIGISSILTEIYLSALDRRIEEELMPAFWCRYVDDIVVVTSAERGSDASKVIRSAVRDLSLALNASKTVSFDSKTPRPFTFLGYRYSWRSSMLVIELSNKRSKRMRLRLERAFEAYSSSTSPARGDLLIKRIRFLARNVRLSNNKRNALTGIYFSNSQLDSPLRQLQTLDRRLRLLTKQCVTEPNILQLLDQESFEEGFAHKRFLVLKPEEMTRVTAIWIDIE